MGLCLLQRAVQKGKIVPISWVTFCLVWSTHVLLTCNALLGVQSAHGAQE